MVERKSGKELGSQLWRIPNSMLVKWEVQQESNLNNESARWWFQWAEVSCPVQMKCLRLRHTSGVYVAQVIQVNQMVLQLDTLPWISGEPSGQESNVFGPLEMLAEEICLAMARTNRWEWTGWGGQKILLLSLLDIRPPYRFDSLPIRFLHMHECD